MTSLFTHVIFCARLVPSLPLLPSCRLHIVELLLFHLCSITEHLSAVLRSSFRAVLRRGLRAVLRRGLRAVLAGRKGEARREGVGWNVVLGLLLVGVLEGAYCKMSRTFSLLANYNNFAKEQKVNTLRFTCELKLWV